VGSCAECPKRTGHNVLLFAGLAAQHDSCKLCGIWATASLFCWLRPAARPA
jgi:ParB family chromosome partitioning protein